MECVNQARVMQSNGDLAGEVELVVAYLAVTDRENTINGMWYLRGGRSGTCRMCPQITIYM